jgi:hypothetical protein
MKHFWLQNDCKLTTQHQLIYAYEVAFMRFSDIKICKTFAVWALERCRQGGHGLSSIENKKIKSVKLETLARYEKYNWDGVFDRFVTVPYDSPEKIKTKLAIAKMNEDTYMLSRAMFGCKQN